MKITTRYLSREVWISVTFVLAALLSLFFLLDLLNELDDVGRGNYRLQSAALFVLMELPGTAYDVLPIAALIGTVYALAQFAATSEFTIMRGSGLSTFSAASIIVKAAIPIVIAGFLIGEYVVPPSQLLANQMRAMRISGSSSAVDLRSGFWIKDEITDADGAAIGTRFVNAVRVNVDGTLGEVRLYEFDRGMRLVSLGRAESAVHEPGQGWKLEQLTETRFHSVRPRNGLFAGRPIVDRADVTHEAERVWNTRLDPSVFSSTGIDPATMSVQALYTYVDHLKRTRQRSTRQEIALWKKFTTPAAVAVMMLLALPFAYLQTRSGAVGVKLFAGIMIGVAFWFANTLSSHVGMLNQWPPLAAATAPAIIALVAATFWLRWVDRH